MLIDIIAIVLLMLAIFKGLRKGLIVALFSLLGFMIGLAAALKLSAIMANYIGQNVEISQRWLPFLAFFIVFVIVLLLVRLGARLVEGAVKIVMLGWLNRLGGVVFYVLIYFFIFSILLFYLTQLGLIKANTVQASVTYAFIQPFAPNVLQVMGNVIPFFGDVFRDLLEFFEDVAA